MTFSTVIIGAGGFLGHRLCSVACAEAVADGRSAEDVLAVTRKRAVRPLAGARKLTMDCRDPDAATTLIESCGRTWIDTAVFDEGDARALILAARRVRERGLPLPKFVITTSIGEYAQALVAGSVIHADSGTSADDPHSAGKLRAFAAFVNEGPWMDVTWAVLPMMWGPGDHEGTGPGGRTRLIIRNLLDRQPVVFEGSCDNPVPDGFVDTIAAGLLFSGRMPGCPGMRRLLLAGPETLTPRGFVMEAAAAAGVEPEIVIVQPGTETGREVVRAFPGSSVLMDCSPLYAAGFMAPCGWRQGVARTVAAAITESSCVWGCQR